MPIESFYEMLVIETPEQAERLVEAFRVAERRGPYVPSCDIMKVLEEGEKDLLLYAEELRKKKESGTQ